MRKILLVAAMLLSGCDGCDKVKQLANINKDIEYKETVDLPGLPGGDTVVPAGGISADLPRYAMATNSAEYLKQYNTSPNLVTHVKLKSLGMTIVAPDAQYFNFLDSVRLFVNAPGLPEQLAAYKYNIAKGMKTVDMDVADLNLKEYFLKDSMYFRINAHFTGIPDDSTKLEIKSVFNILANPLN